MVCNGHTLAGSALIVTYLDLRGKNRETGRALGPKHPRRDGGGVRDEERHRCWADHRNI